MANQDGTPCIGNDCFYGYSIDLLHRLSELLHFNYEIYEAADGKYGMFDDVTKTWNGAIAELLPDANGETVGYLLSYKQ